LRGQSDTRFIGPPATRGPHFHRDSYALAPLSPRKWPPNFATTDICFRNPEGSALTNWKTAVILSVGWPADLQTDGPKRTPAASWFVPFATRCRWSGPLSERQIMCEPELTRTGADGIEAGRRLFDKACSCAEVVLKEARRIRNAIDRNRFGPRGLVRAGESLRIALADFEGALEASIATRTPSLESNRPAHPSGAANDVRWLNNVLKRAKRPILLGRFAAVREGFFSAFRFRVTSAHMAVYQMGLATRDTVLWLSQYKDRGELDRLLSRGSPLRTEKKGLGAISLKEANRVKRECRWEAEEAWRRVQARELAAGRTEVPSTGKRGTGGGKKRRRKRRSLLGWRLTEKQQQILQMVAECNGNKSEAARRLRLDVSTVRQHWRAGMEKLGKLATTSKAPKKQRLPSDRRGQADVSESDDRRRG